MALILPLLCLITFGIIEYGWMFYQLAQVNLAARGGVRVAVRPQADATEVGEKIDEHMADAGWDVDQYDYTITPADPLPVVVGNPIEIVITVPYEHVTLTGIPFLNAVMPTQIVGHAAMAKEGPEPGS